MKRYPAIDVGVVLEGEETFPALLARLDLPRQWLPGFVAPYQGKSSYAPAAGIETKRGCPLGCSYCVYPALQGHRLRFRSPETIVAKVELLHREAGIAWVHFTDPVLNLPPDHFRELCLLLRSRKLPVRWTGFFRENTLTPADAELAVSAGCAAFSSRETGPATAPSPGCARGSPGMTSSMQPGSWRRPTRWDAPIVLYGFYPTFGFEDLLQAMPQVTAAVRGEPEQTLVEVARVAATGARSSAVLGAVPGLALRCYGSIARTSDRPPIADLDALPFPHRSAKCFKDPGAEPGRGP